MTQMTLFMNKSIPKTHDIQCSYNTNDRIQLTWYTITSYTVKSEDLLELIRVRNDKVKILLI